MLHDDGAQRMVSQVLFGVTKSDKVKQYPHDDHQRKIHDRLLDGYAVEHEGLCTTVRLDALPLCGRVAHPINCL